MSTKYDTIGTGYNATRRADPHLTERLFALLKPTADGTYLDLGCGTGNYTAALAEKGLHVVGVEPSETMLQAARERNSTIRWLRGVAEQIPADDASIDGVLATLTIHHWSDLQKSFFEVSRVLKDNGGLVVFTATPEQMADYWLNHYFPKMLSVSARQMPSLERIREAAEKAGLRIGGVEKYFIGDELWDGFLYSGKNRPAVYLDEQVRRGISSFAAIANQQETAQGLARLRQDLKSGAFQKVKEQFENKAGDYLFVVLDKKGKTPPRK